MKKFFVLFVFSCFSYKSYSTITIDNETHTFFVSPQTDKLVVVDRKTGLEQKIETASRPVGLALSKTQAVVTCCLSDVVSFYDLSTYARRDVAVGSLPKEATLNDTHAFIANTSDDKITIIDLKTYKHENVRVGKHPTKIVLSDRYAYVAVCPVEQQDPVGHVLVLSLDTHKIIQAIAVCLGPVDMAIKDSRLYVVSDEDAIIGVIDTDSNDYLKGINVEPGPNRIELADGKAIISHERDVVSVLDLQTEECLIYNVKNRPIYSYLHQDYVLVRSFVDREPGWVTIINLKANTAKQIRVSSLPSSLAVSGDYAFVVNNASQTLSVLSLQEGKVLKEVKFGKEATHVAVTDTHVYLDDTKLMPLFPSNDVYAYFRKKRILSSYLSSPDLAGLQLIKPWDMSKIKERSDLTDLEVLPRDTCLGTIIEYLDIKDIVALALASKNLAVRVGHDTSHDAILRPLLVHYWRGDLKKATDLLRLVGSIGGTLKARFKVRDASSN